MRNDFEAKGGSSVIDATNSVKQNAKRRDDAAQKVKVLFGDESALMDRILALRGSLAASQQALASDEYDRQAVERFRRESRWGAEADCRYDRRRRDYR